MIFGFYNLVEDVNHQGETIRVALQNDFEFSSLLLYGRVKGKWYPSQVHSKLLYNVKQECVKIQVVCSQQVLVALTLRR